jgi:hypothetical protein
MRAHSSIPDPNTFSFGDDGTDRDVEIRKGSKVLAHARLQPITRDDDAINCNAVLEDLVDDGDGTLIKPTSIQRRTSFLSSSQLRIG